jgi:ParB family chromosome partitioning protein
MGFVMNETVKKVEEIDLNDILPNRFQPRIKFNEEKIFELSQSIKEHGVLQPIIVRPIGDKYEIVTGERRYKASVLAGLKTIPSIILQIEDKDSVELALIENVQREDLSPIEEAISYKKILDMGYLTQEELADKLGISQSAIANKKRLLNLCDEVQEALLEKEISERHARSLLKVTNHSVQKDLLYKIISEKLTVRQLDVEITKVLEDPNYVPGEEEPEENNVEVTVTSNNENENNNETTSNTEETIIEKVEDNSSDKVESVVNVEESKITETDTTSSDSVNFDELLSNINSIKENKTDSEDESSNKISINSIELENDNEIKEDSLSVVEEKEENGENDTMNNMMNLDEELNYNNLKNSSNPSGGKFIGVSIDDDTEEKADKKPVIENKSFFDFSSGTVRDDANNNVTITRNIDYDNQNSSTEDNSIFGKKMADLLSTQGSSDLIESDNTNSQNAIFSSTTEQKPEFTNDNKTEEGQTSIFANLMKSEESGSSSIDNDSLQSFLDPSFINGTKEENTVNSDSQINDSIFSKFIDEDFGGEVTPTVSDDSNDLLASTLFGNDKTEVESSDTQTTNLPELSNDVPSILETPTETVDTTPSIFEQTPSIKVDSEKIDLEDLSNSNSQTELISGLMASSKKPDLLAPMNSETKVEEENTTSSIFGLNTEETAPVETTEPAAPEVIEQPETPIEVMSENNDLTPDTSIETESEEEEEVSSIAETTEKPVFITASNDDVNLNAPTTPIITDTKMSNLLSVEKNDETDSDSGTEGGDVVAPVEQPEEQAPVEDKPEETTPITNQNIDIQPIIITDYNKQYDPVLPQVDVPKGPQIEFKHILGMIRDLNDKIESLGYKIDTDEIDLDNTYQVIFNIEKK